MKRASRDERKRHERGRQHGGGRRAARGHRGRSPPEQPIAPHREQDSRPDHEDGVEHRRQRHNRQDRDDLAAAAAEKNLRRVGGGQRRGCEVADGQHGQQRDVHEQVHDNHRRDAADHRPRKVAIRIAVFLRKVQGALPSTVGNHHRLERDDQPGKRRRVRGQPGSGRDAWREHHRGDDHGKKRTEFHDRGDFLKAAADPQPGKLQRGEGRERQNRDRLLIAGKRRQEQRRELAHRNRHIPKNRAVGDPVGPSDGEAHRVAEGFSRIHVISAGPGQHRPQFGQADGADERIQAARDPDRENRRGVRELTGDEAGRSQNADPERAADDDGEAEAGAEDADQTAGSGRRGGLIQHRAGLLKTNEERKARKGRKARLAVRSSRSLRSTCVLSTGITGA